MRCSSDVLKKTSPLDVFGNVSEKVKHLTNDASNDVSPPALYRAALAAKNVQGKRMLELRRRKRRRRKSSSTSCLQVALIS